MDNGRNRRRHIHNKEKARAVKKIRWERVIATTLLLSSLTAGFYYNDKKDNKKPIKNYYCVNKTISQPAIDEKIARHFNSESFRGKTINPVYQMATRYGIDSKMALDITNAYSRCSQGILPPEILLGLIQTESGFIPDTVSYAGAKGIMQLLPSTFNFYVDKYPELFTEGNIFNVYENVCAGILYLEEAYQTWILEYDERQALDLAIGSYFMGIQGLKQLSDDPLKAINNGNYFVSEYVRRVKQYATIFSNQ